MVGEWMVVAALRFIVVRPSGVPCGAWRHAIHHGRPPTIPKRRWAMINYGGSCCVHRGEATSRKRCREQPSTNAERSRVRDVTGESPGTSVFANNAVKPNENE